MMRGSRSSGYIRLHAGQTASFGFVSSASCWRVRRRSFDKLFDTFAYVRRHPGQSDETSRDSPAEEVTVLLYRARQDREVDLTVVINSHDSNDRPALRVAGKQHGARTDTIRIPSVDDEGPPQSIVVLGVQISYEINFQVHHSPPPVGMFSPHGTG